MTNVVVGLARRGRAMEAKDRERLVDLRLNCLEEAPTGSREGVAP